ncbi:MAG: hypothetical protein HY863_00240, partial [Chloroflexi bacterium]|nr:hypothetical protein [Chloroflexota bacterium]
MSATFQPPPRTLTTRDYLFITLVAILFIAVSTGLVFLNLKLKGGGDFYVHWAASRGFIFDKVDPYSAEVPARVQQIVYEDTAKAGDEPYILDTPFQILLLYFPFSLLSDPQLARAIYTLILELALLGLALQSLRLTDWEMPPVFAVLFVIFTVINFYSYQAILEASPVLLLGFLYAEILILLRAEMDELAGALMAVSLYYWEVGAPFLILIFLRMYYEKRTRVFSGLFMVSVVLLIISFIGYPNWILPYLRAGANNLRADFGFDIHTVLVNLWPSYGGIIAWIFIAALVIALGYEWTMARTGEPRRFYWAACLSLAAAPLLGFRTEMEHLSVLVIPLALVFAIVYERWRRFGAGLTYLLLLVVFLVPWAIFSFALNRFGVVAQEITFLFLPLFTILGLYWIRWWAIRPPR